jgi:heme exporter protein D
MNLAWDSLADFAAMGGYALYVWGSFGMVAVALAWELATLLQRHRRALEELAQQRELEAAGATAAATTRGGA